MLLERRMARPLSDRPPKPLSKKLREFCEQQSDHSFSQRKQENNIGIINNFGGSMNIWKLARRFSAGAATPFLATLVLVIGLSTIAVGQQTTGSIVGTVKDQQGAVVNTATVKATNRDTGYSRSAPANGYGEYRIDYLPVGRYTVEATAPT